MVPADVTNEDQVAEAYKAINKAWGDVDVLVNNAGRNSSKRHLRQLTVAEMSSLLDVNLKTAFLCSMAVLPAMRVRKAGTLIHVGSMAATMVFPTAGASYAAAKSGVRHLSAHINAEEGIHGIRSICINPGEVATEILAARPIPPTQAEQALMLQAARPRRLKCRTEPLRPEAARDAPPFRASPSHTLLFARCCESRTLARHASVAHEVTPKVGSGSAESQRPKRVIRSSRLA